MHNLKKKKMIVLGKGFWRLLFLFWEFFTFMCMFNWIGIIFETMVLIE